MKDLFDTAISPMLIAENVAPFADDDYLYEIKWDGERCIAFLDPDTGAELRNKRNVRMLSKVPEHPYSHNGTGSQWCCRRVLPWCAGAAAQHGWRGFLPGVQWYQRCPHPSCERSGQSKFYAAHFGRYEPKCKQAGRGVVPTYISV